MDISPYIDLPGNHLASQKRKAKSIGSRVGELEFPHSVVLRNAKRTNPQNAITNAIRGSGETLRVNLHAQYMTAEKVGLRWLDAV